MKPHLNDDTDLIVGSIVAIATLFWIVIRFC
jgi:hypothetical protein